MISTREFDALPNYSASLPTGQTIGKQWKRFTDEGWFLGEYVESLKPGCIGIEWDRLILPDKEAQGA
jgi:hypothetical protein